jgi:NAD(P)-dependent dehydrogenase (short-subunit alcohol dehydrogenase family)
MSKVWFVTGTSRGFGRVWTEAALERGDRVAATARNVESLAEISERYGDDQLLPLALDVTDKARVDAVVQEAHDHFGRIDVVVNNAGYGLFGAVEEVTEQQARDQLETNLFGALWVTKAALPLLRAQGGGHILQVSSIGGVNAFRNLGLYHASKWALEGMSQALAAEVAPFGIKVTLIEPKGYTTDWRDSSAVRAEPNEAYAFLREQPSAAAAMSQGDPRATAAAIFAVVDADDPPLRLFLGDGPLEMIRAEYGRRLDEWERWNDVAVAAESTGAMTAIQNH